MPKKTHQPYLTGNERIEKVKEMLDEHFRKINLILEDYVATDEGMCDEIEVVNAGLRDEVDELEREEDFDYVFSALEKLEMDSDIAFEDCERLVEFVAKDDGELYLTENLADKNYICVKVENMDKKAKLEDFLKTEIYTTYNDQQTYLN